TANRNKSRQLKVKIRRTSIKIKCRNIPSSPNMCGSSNMIANGNVTTVMNRNSSDRLSTPKVGWIEKSKKLISGSVTQKIRAVLFTESSSNSDGTSAQTANDRASEPYRAILFPVL